ncbi:MAG: YfcC family protein [Oscillospiraceae bacterium]|nr:YfcC family protein [Oscillospiraceae bacterium]
MKKSLSPKASKLKTEAFSNISLRSFLTVVLVLSGILLLCGVLSYIIPQGHFQRDEGGGILPDSYVQTEVQGLAPWRLLTAPFRVFFSEDSLTIIMISLFLLIMSGVFRLLEQTGGVKIFISRIISGLKGKNGPVICITVLIFMLFGSFFGMFEELVTLLPIMIVFMLSMGMDSMMGLGTCLLAACFGFSAAITNPFSVGLASQYMNMSPADGLWLRVVLFLLIYVTVCTFLLLYLRKLRKNPKLSPSYEVDCEKRAALDRPGETAGPEEQRIFHIYCGFFSVQAVALLAIASVRAISNFAIPILAASFLLSGLVAGKLVCGRMKDVLLHILKGAASMLPAVLMIALASSVKLVMTESGILDPIMHAALGLLENKPPFLAIVLIYGLILFLQLFIGSASAKIVLIMPIVMPIAVALGISPSLVILTYCIADGFSDAIIPTNPVLLIGLSMANVSYGKWVKWTWKLQLLVFALTILILFFGVSIGY